MYNSPFNRNLNGRLNALYNKIYPTHFFSPVMLSGWYEPTIMENYNDFSSDYGVTSITDYFNAWEALASTYSDYITSENLGNDATDTYPVYKYTLSGSQVAPTTSFSRKRIKILLTCGLHGEEKSSMFSLYYWVKDICKNWRLSPVLEYFRWNVEFVIIPVANPYGFMHNTRKNGNSVDINRNFQLDWVESEPSSSTYGGTAPFSEIETQYIKAMIDSNTDAIYFGDYHTNGSSGSLYSNLMYFSNGQGDYVDNDMTVACKYYLSKITREFIHKYSMPNDEGFFGFIQFSTGAFSKSYAWQNGIPGNTFECFIKIPTHTSNYNPEAIEMCTEFLGNWIVTILNLYGNVCQ